MKVEFAKNLRASPFDKDLANDTTVQDADDKLGQTLRTYFKPVLRIRIRIRIHIILGLLDPDPDPLVRGMDPNHDPFITKQK